MRRFVNLSAVVAACAVMLIFGMASIARAAIISSLVDDFPGPIPSVDTNWMVTDLARNGDATPNLGAPAVSGGQLTLGGTSTYSGYWSSSAIESVGSFNASLPTTATVDRVSLNGSGSGYESSIWIVASNGDYFEFGQVSGGVGWQDYYDIGGQSFTGDGNGHEGIFSASPLDASDTMSLVFTPEGGDNVAITPYLNGNAGPTYSFDNWTQSSFQVVLMGEARSDADPDTVDAVFSTFDAAVVPEPSSLVLAGIGAIALCFTMRRRRSGRFCIDHSITAVA